MEEKIVDINGIEINLNEEFNTMGKGEEEDNNGNI